MPLENGVERDVGCRYFAFMQMDRSSFLIGAGKKRHEICREVGRT
jgi:hypothetical protein